MPYIYPNPGSFDDSLRRNGLVLSPERQLALFAHETSLFRATHPEIVPPERLGRGESMLRQQFIAASASGEPAVEVSSYDHPISSVKTEE